MSSTNTTFSDRTKDGDSLVKEVIILETRPVYEFRDGSFQTTTDIAQNVAIMVEGSKKPIMVNIRRDQITGRYFQPEV